MRKFMPWLLVMMLLLPVRGMADEPFPIEGDWWAETLFPGYFIELPEWISSLLDLTYPGEDGVVPDRMTLDNQTVISLGKGLAVGCVMENDEPFIALMRRDIGGWNAYFNERVHSYRFENEKFIDLDVNKWSPCTLDCDVLTIIGRPEELAGQIVMYNDDVFAWYNEDQEYMEGGVNYGVPWMLFVRQSAFQ